jgi:exodeoxyribonuclease VII large subunit
LTDSARTRVDTTAARLGSIESHLKHLNPQLVLERGYSIVMNSAGTVVHDAAQIAAGEELTLGFARGAAQAEVKSTRS